MTFAEPQDAAEATQWAATNALSGQSAVSGAEGPGGWKSIIQLVEVQPLSSAIDKFYERAEESAIRSVQAVQDEMLKTPEPWEEPWSAQDLEQNLDDAQAYLSLIEARGAAIGGLATTLSAASASTALAEAAAGDAEVTVVAPRATLDAATIEAPASVPTPTVAARRGGGEDNCSARGDANLVPANVKANINPVFWAPARFKADSVLLNVPGYPGLKEHRLRARWTVGHSLAWMCSGEPDRRNVELEARVTLGSVRWSDAWAQLAEEWEGRQSSWGNTNLPGQLHLDDIATGKIDDTDVSDEFTEVGNPYDKSRYPDFALVAEDGRGVQYQSLYQSNFVTNRGARNQDGSENIDGQVTYSAQATAWGDHVKAEGEDYSEYDYCKYKRWQHASCMFSKSTVCYAEASISDDPVQEIISWYDILGTKAKAGPYPEGYENGQATEPCVAKRDVPNGGSGHYDEHGNYICSDQDWITGYCWLS